MSDGKILSHIGAGLYRVEVYRDTETVEARIAVLETNIAAIESEITETQERLTAASEAERVNPTPENIALRDRAAGDLNRLYLSQTQMQKSLDRLNAYMADLPETIEAWCADLTEDLSGDVGLMDVPGENTGRIVNVRPGYFDRAAYVSDRDGKIKPAAGVNMYAHWLIAALAAGVRKWRPTYRYGEITSLDGDIADVTLEDHYSRYLLGALRINQTGTLTGVSIEYMECNGAAFDVGDSVAVHFGDYDWTLPKIIGFKDHPQPCCPVADFEPDVYEGEEPLTVNFTDQSYGGPIDVWEWDFADGGESEVQHPQHIFEEDGTYPVTLTIYSPYALCDPSECQKIITVYGTENPVMLVLTGNYDDRLILYYHAGSPEFQVGDKVYYDNVSRGTVRVIDDDGHLIGLFAYKFEGGEVVTGDGGVAATVQYCMTHDYRWKYNIWHLRSMFNMNAMSSSYLPIVGPGDTPPAGQGACSGQIISQTWHITLDKFCICVYTYKYLGDPESYWGITASYCGENSTFGINDRPTVNGFLRMSAGHSYFMGVDIWEEYGYYCLTLAWQSFGRYIREYRFDEELNRWTMIEKYNAGECPDLDFYHNNVRLVGLDKRKAYWCRFSTHKYFLQDCDGVSVHTPYGDTGRFADCIWDRLKRKIHWVWDEFETTEFAESSCFLLDTWGYNYYTAAFCTIYDDGSYVGGACEGIGFDGGVMKTGYFHDNLCGGGEQAVKIYYYSKPDISTRVTKTYNIVMREFDGATVIDKTFMLIGNRTVKRGEMRQQNGASKYSLLYSVDGSFQKTQSCCYGSCVMIGIEGAFNVENLLMILSADGEICGQYQTRHYHNVYNSNGVDMCEASTNDETETVAMGNQTIGALASKFPHDHGVLAWLLGGEDCEGADIQPAVLFRGIMQTDTGQMTVSDDLNRMRGLFLPTNQTIIECE